MPKSAKIHLRRFGRPGESAPPADSNQQLSECRRLVQADLIAPASIASCLGRTSHHLDPILRRLSPKSGRKSEAWRRFGRT